MKILNLVVALTVLALQPAWIAKPVFAPDLLIKNAHLVDPETRTTNVGYLILRNGRIAERGITPPAQFQGRVLDAGGRWLVPGFHDMHVHAFANAIGPVVQFTGVDGAQRLNLAAGVTGILDLFNQETEILKLRDDQRAHGFMGADLFAAGALLTCTGGHGTEYSAARPRIVNTPEEARASVQDLARKHPDVVKIVYDHARSMPSMNRQTMESAVRTASQLGLKTVIHIGTWTDAEEAILAGATAITHIHESEIPERVVRLMAQNHVWSIPTLTVESELLNFMDSPQVLNTPLARSVVQNDVLQAYKNFFNPTRPLDPRAKVFVEFQRQNRPFLFKNTFRLASAGVRMLTGTDAGNPGTLLGFSVHREMALMVKSGIPPWNALAASTTEAGAFLGKRYGLKIGDEASLVLLSSSPIADINNTQNIDAVVFHGVVVDRPALTVHSK